MLVYCAADLIWATRIKEAATASGVAARPVRTAAMLADRLADSPVSAAMIDLEAGDAAFDILALLAAESGRGRLVRTIVFGPHVDATGLTRARELGANEVLPRGAFARRLPEILAELAPRSRGPAPGQEPPGQARGPVGGLGS